MGRHYENKLEFLPVTSKEELEAKYGKQKSRLHTFMPLSSDDTTEWEVHVYGADGSYESDTTFVVVVVIVVIVCDCTIFQSFQS